MDEKAQEKPDETDTDKDSGKTPAVAAAPRGAARSEKKVKRKLGKGELIFDFGVYGGISWILNEIVSTVITLSIYSKEAKETLKDGRFYRRFEDAVQWLKGKTKGSHTTVWLAAEMFVITIGGNLMVLLSKPAEDRKGKIVRWIDNKLSGGKGDADPGIKRAHEEMDAAPKQSWFSQAWGRVGVVLTATAIQFGIGAEKDVNTIQGNLATHVKYTAPTTHLFKNTTYQKYSNLGRLMATLTRDIFSRLPFIAKEEREAMKLNRANSLLADGKFLGMQQAEGKAAVMMGRTLGFLLSVSAVTATLFFAYSHILAAFKDKGYKKREEGVKTEEAAQGIFPAHKHKAGHRAQKDEQPKTQEQPEQKPEREKPTAQVAQIENHLTVKPQAPALAAHQ